MLKKIKIPVGYAKNKFDSQKKDFAKNAKKLDDAISGFERLMFLVQEEKTLDKIRELGQRLKSIREQSMVAIAKQCEIDPTRNLDDCEIVIEF